MYLIVILAAAMLFARHSLQGEVPGYNVAKMITITICADNTCDQFNWGTNQFPDLSYQLSAVKFWKPTDSLSNTDLVGFQLTFNSPTKPQIVSPIFGNADVFQSSLQVTQPVTSVEVHMSGSNQPDVSAIRLVYADLTFVDIGTIKPQDDPYVSSVVNLIGFRCSFHKLHNSNPVVYDACYGCIPMDDSCQNYFLDDRPISDMAVKVSLVSTQDVSFSFGKSLNACGPTSYTFEVNYPFFTVSQANGVATMTLATSNPADAQNYSITMTVAKTDWPSVPSITKNFQVTIICEVFSISFSSSPPTQVFRLGVDSQPYSFPFAVSRSPLCTQLPSFTLAANPFFARQSSSGDSGLLIVEGVTQADINLYEFTLTAAVDQVTATLTVQLDIQCVVSSFTVTSQPADATYVLSTGSIQTLPLTLVQNYNCKLAYTFTHLFTKGGVAVDQPSWISFDPASTTYSYEVTDPASIGVYAITCIAATSQLTFSVTWQLTVLHDCPTSALIDHAFNDMTAAVSQAAATQDMFFADSISQNHGNLSYCGSRTYTLTPVYSFLTMTGTILTLSSTNPADVNTYSVQLEVKIPSYPMILPLTKTFQVTVTCKIMTLSFNQNSPLHQLLMVGIDSQPLTIAYSVTKTPLCMQSPTFTLPPCPTFILNTSAGDAGSIVVNGATLADVGLHVFSLTANVDLSTTSLQVEIDIQNPCKSSQIVTSPTTILAITAVMPSTGIASSTYSITTNYMLSDISHLCNLAATLSPSASYISLSSDFQTITVTKADVVLPDDIGAHSFTLTINSADYPTSVTPLTLQVDVDIQCTVSNIVLTSQADDASYVLYDAPRTTLPLDYEQQDNCQLPYTYSHTFTKNGVTIPKPQWINFDETSRTYSYSAVWSEDVGVYVITCTAAVQAIQHVSFWQLTVLHDCPLSEIINSSFDDMEVAVLSTAVTQAINFSDIIGNKHGAHSYCGPWSYELSPQYSFLAIQDESVVLQSLSGADIGEYQATLTIQLLAWPQIKPLSKQFQVKILCIIQSYEEYPFSAHLYRVKLDSPIAQIFSVVPYPDCPVKYELSVFPPAQFETKLDHPTSKILISTNDPNDHGVYNVTLTVSPNYPATGQVSTQSFELTIEDLCLKAYFYDKPVPNLVIDRQSPEYERASKLSIGEFNYFPLDPLKVSCGIIEQSLYLMMTTTKPPEWVQLTDNEIWVDPSSMDRPGNADKRERGANNLQLDLVLKFADYPQTKLTKQFNITINDYQFVCLQNPPIRYEIGEDPVSFAINYQNITDGSLDVHEIVSPQYTDANDNEISDLNWMQYADKDRVFTLRTTNQTDPGLYKVGLSMGYREYPNRFVECTRMILVSYVPVFYGQHIADQKVYAGDDYELEIPKFWDIFGNFASMELDLGEAKKFLVYDEAARTLKLGVLAADMENYLGFYPLKITLRDIKGSIETRWISLTVDKARKKQVKLQTAEISPPKPFIDRVNQYGDIRIGFSRDLVLPTFDRYPEFKLTRFQSQNCTNGGICQHDSRVLSEETSLLDEYNSNHVNLYSVDYNEYEAEQALQIVNKGLVWINGTSFPVIQISVTPGENSDPDLLLFTWNCTKFTNKYMDIEVNWDNVLEVSANDFKEKLKVVFFGKQYFTAEDGQFFADKDAVIVKTLPQQMYPRRGKQIFSASKTIGQTSKLMVVVNFLMSLLLGGALSQLFGVIGKLQIMVHLFLINVEIPVNAQVYFGNLFQLVTYNIIDITSLLRSSLKLEDEPDFMPNFIYLGYQSTFFLINIGNMLIGIIYHIVCLIFISCEKHIKNERLSRFRKNLEKELIWNSLLSFVNESLIVCAVACFLQYKNCRFKKIGESISEVSSIVYGIIIITTMVASLYTMLKHRHKLTTSSIQDKFGVLYSDLKIKRNRSVGILLEPFVGQLRLVLMAFSLVYLQDYMYFQIFIQNMLFTMTIIHQYSCELYEDRTFNFFMGLNECFVAIIMYHFVCFGNLVTDKVTLRQIGMSAIVTITLNLAINFGYIIIVNGKDVYRRAKIWFLQRKLKKLLIKNGVKTQEFIDKQMNSAIKNELEQADQQANQVMAGNKTDQDKNGQLIRNKSPKRKTSPNKNSPRKISPSKLSPRKISPRKKSPRINNSPKRFEADAIVMKDEQNIIDRFQQDAERKVVDMKMKKGIINKQRLKKKTLQKIKRVQQCEPIQEDSEEVERRNLQQEIEEELKKAAVRLEARELKKKEEREETKQWVQPRSFAQSDSLEIHVEAAHDQPVSRFKSRDKLHFDRLQQRQQNHTVMSSATMFQHNSMVQQWPADLTQARQLIDVKHKSQQSVITNNQPRSFQQLLSYQQSQMNLVSPLTQSMRVQNRQKQINQLLTNPQKAEQLFAQLWQTKD